MSDEIAGCMANPYGIADEYLAHGWQGEMQIDSGDFIELMRELERLDPETVTLRIVE